MAKHPHEDLFEGTTMTFGDHLEELRVSLTRALVGLAIGSIIGLIFANHVVAIIQRPLIDALGRHYAELAQDKLEDMYGDDLDTEMMEFAKDAAFVFDEVYLERSLLARLVDEPASIAPADTPTAATPTASGSTPSTTGTELAALQVDVETAARMQALLDERLPSPQPDMIKIRLWRPAKALNHAEPR